MTLLTPTNVTVILELVKSVQVSLGFNPVDSLESLLEKCYVTTYEDIDGREHLVFYNDKKYEENIFLHTCDCIYSSIFGEGNMCYNRTVKWNKRKKELNLSDRINDMEVSIITVLSVLMISTFPSRGLLNACKLMSTLTYWLDTAE